MKTKISGRDVLIVFALVIGFIMCFGNSFYVIAGEAIEKDNKDTEFLESDSESELEVLESNSFETSSTYKTFDRIDYIRVNNIRDPFKDPEEIRVKKDELKDYYRGKKVEREESTYVIPLYPDTAKETSNIVNRDFVGSLDRETSIKTRTENDSESVRSDVNEYKVNKDIEEKVNEFVDKMEYKYGLEKNIIKSLIEVLSDYDPSKVVYVFNGTETRGIMQINTGTSVWIAEQLGWDYEDGIEFDIEKSIEMGAYYLSYMKKRNDDIHYVLTGYNKGNKGVEDWYEEYGTYESEFSRSVIDKMTDIEGN